MSPSIRHKTFVRFSKPEFEQTLSRWQFSEVNLKGTWEYVYDILVPGLGGYAVRIYSSIDKITAYSRDKGMDAIRLMVIKLNDYTHLGEHEKVLRTKGWPDRVASKIQALLDNLYKHICPKCNSAMVLRSGPHGKFMGCSKYPECKHTSPAI
jgi:hypothetical protein